MVSYQVWFEVVHEVASSKSRDGLSREQRGELTSDLAAYWNENKDDLEARSRRSARQLAEQIVEV